MDLQLLAPYKIQVMTTLKTCNLFRSLEALLEAEALSTTMTDVYIYRRYDDDICQRSEMKQDSGPLFFFVSSLLHLKVLLTQPRSHVEAPRMMMIHRDA